MGINRDARVSARIKDQATSTLSASKYVSHYVTHITEMAVKRTDTIPLETSIQLTDYIFTQTTLETVAVTVQESWITTKVFSFVHRKIEV